jgi:hypothetical protein
MASRIKDMFEALVVAVVTWRHGFDVSGLIDTEPPVAHVCSIHAFFQAASAPEP